CEPFSDEDLQTFGEKIEAIDRSAFSNAADRDVRTVRISSMGSASAARGGGGHRPVVRTDAQASEAAREAAQHVFAPTDEPNAAQMDDAAARAERAADDASAPPQPRPMRSQAARGR